MRWQPAVTILIGCALISNAPSFVLSFPGLYPQNQPILQQEELFKALKFLEEYEVENNPLYKNEDNLAKERFSRVPSSPLHLEQTSYLPAPSSYDRNNPPWNTLRYDNLVGNNQYLPMYIPSDNLFGRHDDQFGPNDYQFGPNDNQFDPHNNQYANMPVYNTLDYDSSVDEAEELGDLVGKLMEEVIFEEILENAAEYPEQEESVDYMDNSALESSVDAEMVNQAYELSIPSEAEQVSSQTEEIQGTELSSSDNDFDTIPDVDRTLLEAVILKMADADLQRQLEQEEEGTDSVGEGDTISTASELEASEPNDSITSSDTEIKDDEIDTFINGLMSELVEGTHALADRLAHEIEDENKLINGQDSTDDNMESNSSNGIMETKPESERNEESEVVFDNGWAVTSSAQDEAESGSKYNVPVGDSCPVIDYLLDDCSVVDQYEGLGGSGYKEGFARPCNRHQLCYICSDIFDIPSHLCDELYKAELLSICNNDPECKTKAKYFWLSAVVSRKPFDFPVPVCSYPCVVEYLLKD